MIALDAQTGEPVWSVQTLEPGDGRTITGPHYIQQRAREAAARSR